MIKKTTNTLKCDLLPCLQWLPSAWSPWPRWRSAQGICPCNACRVARPAALALWLKIQRFTVGIRCVEIKGSYAMTIMRGTKLPTTSALDRGATMPLFGRTQYFLGLVVLTYSRRCRTSSVHYGYGTILFRVAGFSCPGMRRKGFVLPWTRPACLSCSSAAACRRSAYLTRLHDSERRRKSGNEWTIQDGTDWEHMSKWNPRKDKKDDEPEKQPVEDYRMGVRQSAIKFPPNS
jgi:hypothetical protein